MLVPGSAVSASSCSLTFGSKYKQWRTFNDFVMA
jgi:hypothetical protein